MTDSVRWSALVVLFAVLLPGLALARDGEPRWIDERTHDLGVYVDVRQPQVVRRAGDVTVGIMAANVDADGDVRVERVRYRLGDQTVERSVDRAMETQRATFHEFRAITEQLEARVAGNPAEATGRIVERRAGQRRIGSPRSGNQDRRALMAGPGVGSGSDDAVLTELIERRTELLARLLQGMFVDKFTVQADSRSVVELFDTPGSPVSRISFPIEIDLEQGGVTRTVQRVVDIPVEPPLPTGTGATQNLIYDPNSGTVTYGDEPLLPTGGGAWFAGDPHVHTTYSLDAVLFNGTVENVRDYASFASLAGLDWAFITDQSNFHLELFGSDIYYTPEQFEAGRVEAKTYREESEFLVFNGQSMGLGRNGPQDLPSHLLVFPAEEDSTGYLPNPGEGLFLGHTNCEDEQVILDRVAAAGGIGFVAHPFQTSFLLYESWNFASGAVGETGYEIWSDPTGGFKASDSLAAAKWLELLDQVALPVAGELPERPGYPSRFPVGIAGSDAHEPGQLGQTFTYANVDSLGRANLAEALVEGRVVVSNGPLAFAEINGVGTGGVAPAVVGSNPLTVRLESTATFGPVGDYWIWVLVDGLPRLTIPPSGSVDLAATFSINSLFLGPEDRHVIILAASVDDKYRVIANPIWLDLSPEPAP